MWTFDADDVDDVDEVDDDDYDYDDVAVAIGWSCLNIRNPHAMCVRYWASKTFLSASQQCDYWTMKTYLK